VFFLGLLGIFWGRFWQTAGGGAAAAASGALQARRNRGVLSVVAVEDNHANAGIDGMKAPQNIGRAVAAAVVDVHDLERLPGFFEHGYKTRVQGLDIFSFVVKWNDDGNFRALGGGFHGRDHDSERQLIQGADKNPPRVFTRAQNRMYRITS